MQLLYLHLQCCHTHSTPFCPPVTTTHLALALTTKPTPTPDVHIYPNPITNRYNVLTLTLNTNRARKALLEMMDGIVIWFRVL